MNRDYEYAEPIGSVEVDQAERRLDSPHPAPLARQILVVIVWSLAVALAVFVVWLLVSEVFALEPAPKMPEAQHQRPHESDKELQQLTLPVAPKLTTAAK